MSIQQLIDLIEEYIISSAILEDALRQRKQGMFGKTLPIEAALAGAEARRDQQRIANAMRAALGTDDFAYSAVVFGNAPVEFWLCSNDRVIWSFVEHELDLKVWLMEVF